MRKGILVYSLVLVLILAAAIILMPAGAQTITGTAHFDPKNLDLALPAPSVEEAIIRFDKNQSGHPHDINASTILLEGSLPPTSTYKVPGGLVAVFDGNMFVNVLWAKIYHIPPLTPPYKIWLTITGNLNNTAGGTPFSVIGDVKVRVPHNPPPP